MKRLVLTVAVWLVPLCASAADNPAGAKIDWKPCDKEVKQFGCKGTDKEIWQCLEKHDEQLGETCDKEHEKHDKAFGEGKY
jgi:hypothetical protein